MSASARLEAQSIIDWEEHGTMSVTWRVVET